MPFYVYSRNLAKRLWKRVQSSWKRRANPGPQFQKLPGMVMDIGKSFSKV
jgi:hypothetical protein